MAKSGEFYTFDEVVRQLKIDEGKLKRLVSEGEISAFREGDIMKFKKVEIDKISTKGPGSETSETVLSEITLEDDAPAFEESGETLTDDLVFESSEPESADRISLGDAGMATEEISSQDTFIEESGMDDVGMTTEPIDLSADLTSDLDDDEEMEEIGAPAGRRSSPARTTRRVEAAPAGSPGMTFCLVLGSILILLALSLAIKTGYNEASADKPLGATFRNMANWFYESMGSNEEVTKEINKRSQLLNQAHSSAISAAKETGAGG